MYALLCLFVLGENLAKGEKRGKFGLYFEILSVLNNDSHKGERLSSTAVARRVNMAYDRFQRHLGHLVKLGFVENHDRLVLTEKGLEYLEEYRRFHSFLSRVGLIER